MAKLQAKVLRKFPEVEVFVEQTKTLARGIHRMWLLRSNGINMLVANSSCNVLLVPLREVKVVAPRNNDYFICRLDPPTGSIMYRDVSTDKIQSTGPVRGAPDPTINLAAFAEQELGLNFSELLAEDYEPDEQSEPEVATHEVVTEEELQEGPSEKTYEELVKESQQLDEDVSDEEIGAFDSLEPPDLDDVMIEDLEFEGEPVDPDSLTTDDVKLPKHKDRITDQISNSDP